MTLHFWWQLSPFCSPGFERLCRKADVGMGGCCSGFSAGTDAFAKTTQDNWTLVWAVFWGAVDGHTHWWEGGPTGQVCVQLLRGVGTWSLGLLFSFPPWQKRRPRAQMSLSVESCPRCCHCGHIPLPACVFAAYCKCGHWVRRFPRGFAAVLKCPLWLSLGLVKALRIQNTTCWIRTSFAHLLLEFMCQCLDTRWPQRIWAFRNDVVDAETAYIVEKLRPLDILGINLGCLFHFWFSGGGMGLSSRLWAVPVKCRHARVLINGGYYSPFL